tara:strand:- start:149 stop:301 length:153 start_codon:yes stop_codon:yes gene_type:complete
MTKYAVVEEDESVKTAEEDARCPLCGSELDPEANVPFCPVHGTKPFEKAQ